MAAALCTPNERLLIDLKKLFEGQSMKDVDLRLEDCYSILLGYHQTLVNQNLPVLQDTEELSGKLSNLEGNLEHLKKINESD